MMTRAFSPAYFADENALGMAKVLARMGRDDFVYPGHESLADVPVGALDLEWMPIIGARGLIVITRDRRIRTRPAELTAYRENGIRSVWIGAKRDLRPQDQAELFLANEDRLRRQIIKLGGGPWALSMSLNGARPIHMPD